MSDCLFCKIINKEIPADFVYEDNTLVVFKDIHPKANTHWLIVPREHINSLNEVTEDHKDIVFYTLHKIPALAKMAKLPHGFRTIINTGRGGGQEIDHIHFHLLGGSGRLPGF